MGQRRSSSDFLFSFVPCLLLILFCVSGSAEAYKNYTVGDSLGWFDNTVKSNANYQKWVANKEFSLGDFLIFNTDNNHSVVQTFNFTTYKLCDYEDAQDKDTIQWSAADPSNTETHPVSVAVPLVKEGMNYFFSSDYDGDQCKSGQHFKINVTYGQGLPKSLKNSPDDSSPSPNSSPVAGDDESAPDTIVPSSFSHPIEESDEDKASDKDKEKSSSVSLYAQFHSKLLGSIVLLGIVFLF